MKSSTKVNEFEANQVKTSESPLTEPAPLSVVSEELLNNFNLRELDTGVVPSELLLTPRDTEALVVFDRMKRLTLEMSQQLQSLRQALEKENNSITHNEAQLQQIRNLEPTITTELGRLVHQLFNYDVELLQQVYDLRVERKHILHALEEANHRINFPETAVCYRVARRLDQQFRNLKSRIVRLLNTTDLATLEEDRASKKIADIDEEHHFYELRNPYADVDNRLTAFEIFRNWVTIFHINGKRYGSSNPLVNDKLDTIYELNHYYRLTDKKVLELGPLEAGNTKQMIDLGAKFITAIESNRESFVKCLIAQNEIPLTNTHFIFGDLNEVLLRDEFTQGAQYDVCVASGLLYHMEDPILAIDLIVQTAPAVYVWSHVASKRTPNGPWVTITDQAGRTYQGRQNEYKPTDVLGGVGRCAVWLTPEDLRRAFEDRGYAVEDIGSLQNYKGDAIKFIATKR